ncbi:hypothetical protein IAT38_006875 [Cryptococcus sp. DSM 104549]
MPQDFNQQLTDAHYGITELVDHIHEFPAERLVYHAPVIDRIRGGSASGEAGNRSGVWVQDEVMGLRKFVEGVEHQERLVEDAVRLAQAGLPPAEDPLPSVLQLTTAWKIIATAQPPIVSVRMPMGGDRWGALKEMAAMAEASGGGKKRITKGCLKASGKRKGGGVGGGGKEKEVWVDVVAQGGKEWIRIYSKKMSHLIAEFREADSYVNSDYDSDTPSSSSQSGTPMPDQPVLSNSLFTTAQDLIRAMRSSPRIPGAPAPSLTLWLTRLPSDLPSPGGTPPTFQDERYPQTLALLRSMGFTLRFGSLEEIYLEDILGHPVPRELAPSLRLNLDITALMGLCSDVLHHPLPTSRTEAARRSLRPPGETLGKGSEARGRDGTGKGKGKGKREAEEDEVLDEEEEKWLKDQSQNSRELYRCILEEVERPFVDELNGAIRTAWEEHVRRHPGDAGTEPRVEFWTTRQAAQYTYEALSSGPAHGHGGEHRRMKRMLGMEEGSFFEGSRYEGKEGYMRGFKVRVFDDLPDEPGVGSVGPATGPSATGGSEGVVAAGAVDGAVGEVEQTEVERTDFHRSLEAVAHSFLVSYYTSLLPPSAALPNPSADLPSFLQPKKMPSPPVAKISLPFPVVSLHSLWRGGKEGMTTVMMGAATFKEVWGQTRWRARGWERAGYDLEKVGTGVIEGYGRVDDDQEEEETMEKGCAAVMIFPYRVFGEGKRVRFEQGDYSYPNK